MQGHNSPDVFLYIVAICSSLYKLLSFNVCREKYLNTLLQVEMLLKLWFPQISTQPVSAASSIATSPARSFQDTSSATPPHKHRDQLHIPVKVRTHTFPCVQERTLIPHDNPISPSTNTTRNWVLYSLANESPAHFPEAQTQLDRYGLPHAFPSASQVRSYQVRRQKVEARPWRKGRPSFSITGI